MITGYDPETATFDEDRLDDDGAPPVPDSDNLELIDKFAQVQGD